MLVFYYERVSSKKQDAEDRTGLERQRQNLERFIEQTNARLFDTYNDVKSGKTTKRKGLERLKRDIRDIEDDRKVVFVDSIDRLSRADIWTALGLIGWIKDSDCEIFDNETQTYYGKGLSNFSELLVLLARLDGAANYIRNLSYRSTETNKIKRKQIAEGEIVKLNSVGKWLEWDDTNKQYKLKSWAKHLKHVCLMYANGEGYIKCVDYLVSNGVESPFKGTWHPNTLKRIFKNKSLYGVYEDVKRGIRRENYFPALLSESEFNRLHTVQQSKMVKRGRTTKNIHPLSGLTRCMCCGGRFQRRLKTRTRPNGSIYRREYFHCVNSTNKQCSNTTTFEFSNAVNWVLEVVDWDSVSDKIAHSMTSTSSEKQFIEEQIANLRNTITEYAMNGDIERMNDTVEQVKGFQEKLSNLKTVEIRFNRFQSDSPDNEKNAYLHSVLDRVEFGCSHIRLVMVNGDVHWLIDNREHVENTLMHDLQDDLYARDEGEGVLCGVYGQL
ncbi:recombinase family protein [Shewanella algae]|uniref:recombinase family protein n=1 Tax=Shewanella algae TaxID=38313 RepID=UPI001BF08623|nr:recombinase family protein [Shewanella algae]BCV28524.1 hypothetical protein TUM3811_23840 [Shewanella algae]